MGDCVFIWTGVKPKKDRLPNNLNNKNTKQRYSMLLFNDNADHLAVTISENGDVNTFSLIGYRCANRLS